MGPNLMGITADRFDKFSVVVGYAFDISTCVDSPLKPWNRGSALFCLEKKVMITNDDAELSGISFPQWDGTTSTFLLACMITFAFCKRVNH